MPDLLLEIGCEEIPAGFLAGALPELANRAKAALEAAKLWPADVATLGTPRRLALLVRNLPARQPDVDEELKGPPTTAGDKARDGFARKFGLEAKDVKEEGGRFVARRHVKGQDARALLPALLAPLIAQQPWPKSMRWAEHPETFVRPVHWIVALYDGEVVPVEFAGVKSGRSSQGHRFLAPAAFEVGGIDQWRAELKKRFVIVDPAERRQLIESEIARIEGETKLKTRPDEALLAEVTNLVEYPVGVAGSFDERFLEVPEAVVVSAMRGHQRYFAMLTPAGKLASRFLTIAGTIVKDAKVVAHGNERVLRARLSDARFFFDEDRKVPLDERAKKLGGIVWIKQRGTMADKVGRVKEVAAKLAKQIGVDVKKVERAAELCKADLLTHLVGEFPDLQGLIGREYARAAGEDAAVADAIAEHYQPRGAQDTPAKGDVGAVLAVADRIDTLNNCFAAGLAPTGSADPYGLRRAALGILQTVLAHQWRDFSMREAFSPEVLEFVKGRFRGLLAEEFPADLVDAVLAVNFDHPLDLLARLRALSALRARADFEPLGIAIKRVGNILKGIEVKNAVDPGALKEPQEKALFDAYNGIRGRAAAKTQAREYDEALRILTEFKAPVDAFFDKVFVMDKDERIKNNRLALLAGINELFLGIADFRQLNLG
jgi:glycyl-tRNA synthetase beta chain